jgi:mRNA interferase RelE/StbE
MNHSLFILPRAQKELAQLHAGALAHVRDAIRELANDPRPPGCPKLTGREGWRLRVGEFRVIYQIDEEHRLNVGHRRDVYR